MSVDLGYFRHIDWAVPWVWAMCAALWVGWLISHDKVSKAWMKPFHERVGRAIHPIRILICLLVFLGTGLALRAIMKPQEATRVAAPSSQPQQDQSQAGTQASSAPSSPPLSSKPKTSKRRNAQSSSTSKSSDKATAAPSQPAAGSSVQISGDVHQSNSGDCTANVIGGNANLDCDSTPPPRIIPPENYKQLHDYLAASPGRAIVSVSGNQESYKFARSMYSLLKDAGWSMQDGDVRGTTILGAPPREGVTVKYHGTPLPEGQREPITGDKPEDHIGQVLGVLKVNPSADRSEQYPEGVIEIEIGDQPKQPKVKPPS
jgi:hypothetical protein